MESPTTPKTGNAEALDIDKETIAQTGESATPKVAIDCEANYTWGFKLLSTPTPEHSVSWN
ncbi:MAG: hypothetical protein HN403_08955 [Rhodospirillales bacterium]|jgi:hypothetical protein|nr:hypothetical protein [Rhodospirillales bacterium]